MKACCPVALVTILLEFGIGCHTFSVNTVVCSTVPCMILVLSYVLHDRLGCGFILCLTCTCKTKHLHSLPFPKSLTLTFLVRESELLQMHHEGFQMDMVSNSPLFIVILYLYERPVLNGLWLQGGRISSNFTTSLFLTFMTLSYIFFLMSDFICFLAIVCI